jgi:hypothetical protein
MTVAQADRVGPPVSNGEAAGQARPEGKGGGPASKKQSGPVVGHTGRPEKGRRLGRNRCSG